MLTGIQGAKTTTGALWMGKKYGEYPYDNHAIVAPTYKILEQSTLPTFFKFFPFYKKFYKIKDSIIELPNPKIGKIFVRSADTPITLEGMTCRDVWCDEIGQIARYAWIILQGRVSFLQGQIFGTTRPYGINWLKTDFYDLWQANDPEYEVINFESKDNPAFPYQEYLRAKKRLDPRVFAMMYQGKFERMVGLVYQQFDENKNIFSGIVPFSQFKKIVAGVDWGYTNPAVIILIGITNEGEYYVFYEFYKTGLTIDSFTEIAKQLQKKFRIDCFFADPSEPMNIQQFRKEGINIIEGDNQLNPGINKVRELIGENKLFIHSTCKNIIDEFQSYCFAEAKDIALPKEKPQEGHNHGLDSIRYVVMTSPLSEIEVLKGESSEIGKREDKDRLYLHEIIGEGKKKNWLEF